MNRLLSASAFLCSTLGLVLMILACFLVPHHVVLGDDPGGGGQGGTVGKCDGDVCATTCSNCIVSGSGATAFCQSLIENGTCACNANPQGKDCSGCTCKVVLSNPDDPTSQPVCKCR
jgi:hypothetical protein